MYNSVVVIFLIRRCVMARRLIIGLPGSREFRKQFSSYFEHWVACMLGVADDSLDQHLRSYLQYITYKRSVITSGRIGFLLLERDGDSRATVDLVVERESTTRIEVDTYPVGSSTDISEQWYPFVVEIIQAWLVRFEVSLEESTRVSVHPPQQLTQPGPGSPREAWFEYKRQMGRAFTHNQLADALGLSPVYVRQIYSNWKKGVL